MERMDAQAIPGAGLAMCKARKHHVSGLTDCDCPGRRHAYSIYDYLAYCDDLGRDLGIRTQRKKNMVLEMFQPYRPSDYRGLIEEYLAANPAAGCQGR